MNELLQRYVQRLEHLRGPVARAAPQPNRLNDMTRSVPLDEVERGCRELLAREERHAALLQIREQCKEIQDVCLRNKSWRSLHRIM